MIIKDNGDKLVEFDSNEFVLEPVYFKWGHVDTDKMYLREGAIEKLRVAQENLRKIEGCKGWSLKIWDGFRTLETQKILYDDYYVVLKQKHPDWTDEKLRERVEVFVCLPSYDPLSPSYHNTGGTVDLTLVDENGDEIPMGTPFDEFTERAFVDHLANKDDSKSVELHKNRMLLQKIMQDAGFINYEEEWWHFSYGTKEWAIKTGADEAIYGSVEL
ncbi:M15 family metallopeptidase [Patescibacteria group bacterium]